jgi:ribosomal protein S17E
MPILIWEEIARNYRNNIENQFKQAERTLEKINHHIDFLAPSFNYYGYAEKLKLTDLKFTPKEITDRYLSFLKATLKLQPKDFLYWDNKWMPEIISRSIEHTKPFAEDSDKGFKDTLIWKTILSLANKPGFKEAPIVFISANNRDFGDRGRPGEIHPTLAKEAKKLDLTLCYFDNLDMFFEKWAGEVLNANFDKIRRGISDQLIKESLRFFVRPYMPRNESVVQNTFITGVSFKVTSETKSGKTIRVSISGYITNTIIPLKYLEFNAEAIFEDGFDEKTLVVESFSILDQDNSLQTILDQLNTMAQLT